MVKRRKRILILVTLILGTPILLFATLYRLTNSQAQEITREIQYQLIDIGQLDKIRFAGESVLWNRRIWVVTDQENPRWLYVSKDDYGKLWPEPWPRMKEKNYTIEATFVARPLLLVNGYGIATLKEIRQLQKDPIVRK
jgi:hypothetical protein